MKANPGKIFLGMFAAVVFGPALIWQCARMGGGPGGGDRDTLPPRIVSASPAFNSTDFAAKRIYVAFDEYVQIKDLQKEFFTSPPMKKTPLVTVRGKGIQVDIRDTLLENTTYVLNLGSSVVDNNEGNPLHGFRYVFSTGAEIDSLFASGYVEDAFRKDSVSKALIYFFDARADSMEYDSVIYKSTPLKVERAETDGLFFAQNLAPMDYRIYAVEDTNGNFMYDPGVDKVAFLDGVYNPLDLPDFDVRYDTTLHQLIPEPQLYFRAFTDTHFKRQNLAANTRPEQHRINLIFSAPYPQIDSLVLEGIDPARIITEYVSRTRDTMNLWLNVPSGELPDTIKGRITYMKHDSINNLVMTPADLRLPWRYIESREEKRERERQEKERERAEKAGEEYVEPKKPNPFSFRLSTTSEINPEKHVSVIFETPVVQADTEGISLTRVDDIGLKYGVDFTWEQDSVDIKKYNIAARWAEGESYELVMADSIFTDIAGHRNDSLAAKLKVLSQENFGTLNVNVKGKTDSSLYVISLRDVSGKLIQEKKYVTSGTHTFRFLNAGDVRLHVLEDNNGNGEWDTGSVINRRQPERVEVFGASSGNDRITVKVNWEIDVDVDMNELFKPVDIMDIRRELRRKEELRIQQIREEAEKKRQEEENRSSQGQQGFGIGGAMQGMGGARQGAGGTGARQSTGNF